MNTKRTIYLLFTIILVAFFISPAFSSDYSQTTRFPKGLTNSARSEAFGDLIIPDRTKVLEYVNNFSVFNQHIVSTSGAGAVVSAATGDFIMYATGYVTANISAATKSNMYIGIEAKDDYAFDYEFRNMCFGQNSKGTARLWYKAKARILHSTEGEMIIGVGASTAGFPHSASGSVQNGLFFTKDDDSNRVDFIVASGGTKTVIAGVDTKVSTSTVYVEYAFYYDGNVINIFIDGTKVGTAAKTNFPMTSLMGPIFAYRNGTAVAGAIYLDYVSCIMERY